MVCFLASRLSPLASRGIVAALVFCACLFCGSGRAFASDWEVTYAYDSGADQPGTASGLCGTNSSVTKTRTVKVTATVTWKGMGNAPKRVKISEAASVSWGANLTISQNSIGVGDPPRDPHGSMSGSGSTGLTDVITNVPNPWTNRTHGQSIAGTREGIYTIPDNGVFTLPQVTQTATATATTQDETTGGVSVSVGSYSVTVPDGSASATATVTITPPTGWVAGAVDYGEAADGSYDRKDTTPTITVHVGGGVSKEKELLPVQTFTYTVAPGGNPPSQFTGSATTGVSGSISEAGSSFYSSSDASISGSDASKPAAASGSAPPGTEYTDEKSSAAYKPLPVVTPGVKSVVTVNMALRAKASTIGQ